VKQCDELLRDYKGMYKLVKEVNKLKKQSNKPYGENKKAAEKRKG